MLSIRQAATPEEIEQARQLFQEYAASLDFSLCFQSFDEELKQLPGYYVPPQGRLLLSYKGTETAGCVALRPLGVETDRICEMKRLYIRPRFRGHNLGRTLLQELFEQARTIGYRRMRLDTVAGAMGAAIALYRQYGFREISPYTFNPVPGVLYMELELDSITGVS